MSQNIIRWAERILSGHLTPAQLIDEVQTAYPNQKSAKTYMSNIKKYVVDRLAFNDPQPLIEDLIIQCDESGYMTEDIFNQLSEIMTMSARDILYVQKRAKQRKFTKHPVIDSRIAELPIIPDWVHELRIPDEPTPHTSTTTTTTTTTTATTTADNRVLQVTHPLALFEWLANFTWTGSAPLPSSKHQKLIACALISGRRFIELMLTGTFEEYADDPYCAVFSGQVKKGPQHGDVVYVIPLLAPFPKFQELLQLLRVEFETNEMENTDANRSMIHRKYQRSVNTALHRELDSFIQGKYHFHDLRAIYAQLTYEIFKPDLTYPAWIQQVLGHENIQVSIHYNRLRSTLQDEIQLIGTRFFRH